MDECPKPTQSTPKSWQDLAYLHIYKQKCLMCKSDPQAQPMSQPCTRSGMNTREDQYPRLLLSCCCCCCCFSSNFSGNLIHRWYIIPLWAQALTLALIITSIRAEHRLKGNGPDQKASTLGFYSNNGRLPGPTGWAAIEQRQKPHFTPSKCFRYYDSSQNTLSGK